MRLSEPRAVSRVPLAVLDLEMTGLSPKTDRVCEVAILRTDGRGGQECWSSLVRPGIPMSQGAVDCHGISDADVADAPTFAQLADRILELLDGAVLVAHNAPFDIGFLEREFLRSGIAFEAPPFIDTLLIARRLFSFRRNNLATVCQRLGVPLQGHHRALSDVRATHAVFERMMAILDPEEQWTLDDLDHLLAALAPDSPFRLSQRRTLNEAFSRRETVWIDYQSTSDPLEGLVHREVAIWKLRLPRIQGWCHLRDAGRVFRLDRCRNIEVGERHYELPVSFNERI